MLLERGLVSPDKLFSFNLLIEEIVMMFVLSTPCGVNLKNVLRLIKWMGGIFFSTRKMHLRYMTVV